jgi:type I restriction enzyme R subunit
MGGITEDIVEKACLSYFGALGYETVYGPAIGPGGISQERSSWDVVILVERLSDAVRRINADLPASAVDSVVKTVLRPESQNVVAENLRVHQLVTKGVAVEYRAKDGSVRQTLAWLVDFDKPDRNNWMVANQYTVVEAGRNRRPDVVVFVNGLPLGIIELKNPGDENATLKGAFNQLQTYRKDISSLFTPNAICVVSDGLGALMGSFSAGNEHYAPWKTIDSKDVVADKPQLEVLVRGVFERARFLDIIRNFVVFSDEPVGLIKRVTKYHQYWAVNAAIESTIKASGIGGDRRGGVVWHTQGSGKSFEMLCYAAKAMRSAELANPTLIMITDRNDLDDQLYGEVFAPARILPEEPKQAGSRAEMRKLLDRVSGGIVFTTLQKFAPDEKGDVHPVLTDRRNVIVIADEAHRSQYDFLDGYARHLRDALPNATYLGFTGTPIETADKSTRSVFGDYVDVYDLTRAVTDGATVRIFYESRLAKVKLPEGVKTALDEEVDEITEGAALPDVERAKSRWARLEAIVGSADRLDVIAADIVGHWEKRRENLLGKAMIVGMSRRICVDLYARMTELRPGWHSDDPMKGRIKVVMTGSATDPAEFQQHIYPKEMLRNLKARAKNADDELEIVIVRDMWLTGFDAPSMHTMYVDKPMQGAGLMQAIARVNRTFRDKPGGLIVDYIGIAQKLREALADYSPTDREQAGVPLDEVVAIMIEKHDIVCGILAGSGWGSDLALPPADRVRNQFDALNHVLADLDRKERFLDQTLALLKAFALAGATDATIAIRNDVRFFADVRAQLVKLEREGEPGRRGGSDDMDSAIAQLVSEAVSADGIIDIYALAGMERPDISILSDAFLEGLIKDDRPNVQMQLLRKLINDEIRTIRRTNVVQARMFSALLDGAILKYTNRNLTTAEIIVELVELAKKMRDGKKRSEELGLATDEIAFYDAVCQNDSAILQMGDDTLRKIAKELVEAVRSSISIDWNMKDSVRAGMRAKVKRLLTRYDYPPDKEEGAIDLILEQAELIAIDEAS